MHLQKKRTILPIIFFLFLSIITCAQNNTFTLEAIWRGAFRTEGLDDLHPMNNGKQYSVFNYNSAKRFTSVDVYDYATQKKVKTVVSSAQLTALNYFTDYTFSPDEQKLILATEGESIYRYSSRALYYVYDINAKKLIQISEDKIQEPTFSPDGKKVAYALENNLYIFDIATQTTAQITFDGKKNEIINGTTDWVYEEEFAFVRAFEWNTGSTKLAFIRFDETNVREFSMDIYGTGLYPTQSVFKYPKAGEANAKVTLHVYDIEKNVINPITVNKTYSDFYIPRLKWTRDASILSAQFLNRSQNALDLWFIDTEDETSELVLEETDKAYVDITDNLTFLEDNSFVWTSEKDGFNHIYHYDSKGRLKQQITEGNWEVTEFYGLDEKQGVVYYQSTEKGSTLRDVYSVKLNGRHKTCLSTKQGTNAADFSADFSVFINTFSNIETPPEYTLHDANTGVLKTKIKDNKGLLNVLSNYALSKKVLGTLDVNGNTLNMWMLKPSNFDASKKYPLLMYQYSGPGSQEVSNSWLGINDYWFQMLANQGYIIACVDGRGTGYKGAKFKKVTQGNLGYYEVEDQIEAAKQLGALPYIDSKRIGIWGWSYGGFMSANCLFKGNSVFKMAIAVAPVSSWRFYDTIYTERYLGLPQDNPKGYDLNSPIAHVDKMQGDFLLVHGSADDNVHLQNTTRLAEALIQADKHFDWAIYPDKNHGIYGGNTRVHLYKKMTRFIQETLGNK